MRSRVGHGTLQFIAVGTPPDEDGSADLQYVLAAARDIGQGMTDYKVVINKSTVPVGTGDKVRAVDCRRTCQHAARRMDFCGRLQPRVPERRRSHRPTSCGRTAVVLGVEEDARHAS